MSVASVIVWALKFVGKATLEKVVGDLLAHQQADAEK